MPYIIGVVISLAVALFARRTGFDRDRSFYPTVLIVTASYYVLFATMSDSIHAVVLESIVMTGFLIAAVAGFKWSPWILVGALVGHGVMDMFHSIIVENPGVPIGWPAFCLAFDFGAATCLAWILRHRPVSSPEAGRISQLSVVLTEDGRDRGSLRLPS